MAKGVPERRYRPELHGLRGLAIALVVLFHLFGGGRVSGGIDVFLAVSGFLFTGMLLREAAENDGLIDPVRYLGRLARRLLPPLALVVATVTAAGLALLPPGRHVALLREAAASLLYQENWELITNQLEYAAAGPATSPFQHIWSLSVQGQFYLLWPLLTMLTVAAARALRVQPRAAMVLVTAAVIAGSALLAVQMHGSDQARAYLHTGTRLWELGAGALLALVSPALLPRAVRPAAGWLGLGLIVSCGFVLDGGALFPGPWAWWPVLGFVLVMLAEHPARWGVTELLQTRALQWIGDVSYSLYLWHWPLLVLWLVGTGRDRISLPAAVALLLVSTVLAWLTNRLLERPVTSWLTPRPALAVVAGVSVIAVGAGTAHALVAEREERRVAELAELGHLDPTRYPGGRVLGPAQPVLAPSDVDPLPSVELLAEDLPEHDPMPCRQRAKGSGTEEVLVCDDPAHPAGSPGASDLPVVVATGGSHGAQWAPALRSLAREHGWRLLVVEKAGCQLTTNDGQYPPPRDPPNVAPTCVAWNDAVIDVLDGLDPDLLVTIGSTTRVSPESTPHGFLDQIAALRERGVPVVTLRDNPRRPQHMGDCLAAAGHPSDCDIARHEPGRLVLAETNPWSELAEPPEGVGHIDLSGYYCPDQVCPAVIGNIVTYRDDDHLSATFVRSLAPALDAELREEAPHLYAPAAAD